MMNQIRLQPLVHLSDDTIFGYEALFRKENWADYPSASYILGEIASSRKYSNNFQLFINMTVQDVIDPNFYSSFLDVLEKEQVDASKIVLEVSESTRPDSLSVAKKTLCLLRQHNIKIALDDFGTEYSSLSFLHELPVDIVKIDKKFVQEAPSNRKARALLQFCVNVSHDIGCEVVAEGVESMDHLDCVKNSNVDIGQGFIFASSSWNFRKNMTPFIDLCDLPPFPIGNMPRAAYC
ncbi:MAG: EAL domain-containing protein [Holosporaceae bacterium]|jgi:EAL domain-containing protein (putative c-di-GMP-specific phosphodiesterase class I)|nr:EAL domain-containing protein [Holosporaceae bacterium]